MGAWRRVASRLRNFLRPSEAEAALSREVAAHLALIEDDLRAHGISNNEARIAARRAFGGLEQTKERQRDERSFRWLEDLRQDVRYAAHGLARAPGFTAVATLTIALGTGANTAIFSVVRAVLINPLPFADGERLVSPYENVPAEDSRDGKARRMSGMELRELLAVRASAKTLSNVISTRIALVSIAGGINVREEELTSMPAEAFQMLGVSPLLGRWFTAEDARSGDEKLIVLSYAAWQRHFSGNPAVLGQTIAFNGNTFSAGVDLDARYTIVGVMPKSFHFPDDGTQFWTPLTLQAPADNRSHRVPFIGRLAAGVSRESATAEVSAILQNVRTPASGERRPAMWPASRFEFVRVEDEVGASVKPALMVLTTAVGFLLLIACANIVNLLLARASARQREFGVRVALGAGRGRLIRQLLTEAVLLAIVGGGAGTLVAFWGIGVFRSLGSDLARVDLGSLGTAFPRLDAIVIDAPVLGFALAVSLVTGLLVGLLPAIWQSHGAPMDVLRAAPGQETTRKGSRRLARARGIFVVAEIALATGLFVGGSLLLESFAKLATASAGFDPSHVLTFQVGLPGSRRPDATSIEFAENLAARLAVMPGAQATAYANQLPMVALQNTMTLNSRPDEEETAQMRSARGADVRLVSRDYLKTMGIRVVAGRPFGPSDMAGSPRVMVINQTVARRDFPDGSAVGATVYVRNDTTPWQIIGIAEDVRQQGLDREPEPQFFAMVPQWQLRGVPVFPVGAYYAVRTIGDPGALLPYVRRIVAQADVEASLENVATMDEIVSNGINRPRMYAVLVGTFAAVAVALATAGIYGVMAYTVARRTRELGIRMALGARASTVRGLVLRHSSTLTLSGLALGLALAAGTTRYLQGLLFGLTPLDVATFVEVAVVFAMVATAAAFVPARRATKVDPLIALRSE